MCKICSSPVNTGIILFNIEVVMNLLFVVREIRGYESEWFETHRKWSLFEVSYPGDMTYESLES